MYILVEISFLKSERQRDTARLENMKQECFELKVAVSYTASCLLFALQEYTTVVSQVYQLDPSSFL